MNADYGGKSTSVHAHGPKISHVILKPCKCSEIVLQHWVCFCLLCPSRWHSVSQQQHGHGGPGLPPGAEAAAAGGRNPAAQVGSGRCPAPPGLLRRANPERAARRHPGGWEEVCGRRSFDSAHQRWARALMSSYFLGWLWLGVQKYRQFKFHCPLNEFLGCCMIKQTYNAVGSASVSCVIFSVRQLLQALPSRPLSNGYTVQQKRLLSSPSSPKKEVLQSIKRYRFFSPPVFLNYIGRNLYFTKLRSMQSPSIILTH